jgi:uncharacterized protein involved in exopolysaccharide biosynthesis/Mrp family chromosome partitioning ATPase
MSQLPGNPISMEQLPAGDARLGASSGTLRPIPAGNAEQALFRLDLRRSLQLHGRLALAIALAALALAAIYVWRGVPIYTAESVLFIQPAPPTVLQQNGGGQLWPFDSTTYESYIAQQMQNVLRQDVLTAAAQKLGNGVWKKAGESDQSAGERLRGAIEVARVKTTYQVSIAAHAKDAVLAAGIANAVANSYIESLSTDKKMGDALRLAALHDERERVQKELASDRAEQEALNAKLGQAAIGAATPDHLDDDITLVRSELVKARADHDEAAAKFTSVGGEHGPSSASLDAEADELIASDAGLVSMKTALNARRAVLISQMANLTPSHPQYKQDAEELAKINQSLESMMNGLRAKAAARIQLKLRTDLERTAGVEGRLNAQLGQLTGTAGSATSKLQRASDLATDIARLQARFATVDEQWRNLIIEDGAPGTAYIATPATAPLHSANSKVLRNAAVILFAGIMFGLLAAAIANKMDAKIYTAADVEQVLGFAPIAQLPDFDEVPDGVAEEQLLRLATAIEYAGKQGDMKSCIFTGAVAGTGVTTVAGRVRDLLEAMGRTTVLVDASGAPPPAPRDNAGGQAEQALATIQRPSRSSALVRQMAEETETQDGSLVLTDTAPLVVSAETEYLARHVDCAIVVVRSGVTTRAQLHEAAAALQRLDVAAVGFVLNRIGLQKADPAFRLSVRAIEDHLNAQRSESRATRTVRSQPFPVEDPFAGQRLADSQIANERVPAKPAESAPAQPAGSSQLAPPAPAAQAPARPSPVPEPPLSVHEHLFVPVEPSPVPPRTSKRQQQPAPVEPLPISAQADPWWLAQVLHQPDPLRYEPLPQPAVVAEPRIVTPLEPTADPAPEVAKLPEPLLVHEPPPVAVVPQPVVAEPDPVPVPKFELAPPPPIEPPVQAWESAPAFASAVDNRAVPEDAQDAGQEQTVYQVASRFDGLRNLVTVLGLKQMHETEVPHEPAPKPAPKPYRVDKLSVFERAFVPAPEPVSASVASASPRLVTAQPEFLPPQPIVYTPAADRRTGRGASDGPDRRAGNDEVRILPSKRGQYKKR